MCYNCGCGMIYDNMGSEDNITESSLTSLADSLGKSLHQTKLVLINSLQNYFDNNKEMTNKEVEIMFEKAGKSWGQSPRDAKKNTYRLLLQATK